MLLLPETRRFLKGERGFSQIAAYVTPAFVIRRRVRLSAQTDIAPPRATQLLDCCCFLALGLITTMAHTHPVYWWRQLAASLKVTAGHSKH